MNLDAECLRTILTGELRIILGGLGGSREHLHQFYRQSEEATSFSFNHTLVVLNRGAYQVITVVNFHSLSTM